METNPPPKGHWPRGKRRHSEPADWPRIRAALDLAAERRQSRLIARETGTHVDTLRRWRRGIDLPAARYVGPLIRSLYALHLYWERSGRAAK